MSKIDLHLDSATQEWLDTHPGPWSLVQSKELAELRAKVDALKARVAMADTLADAAKELLQSPSEPSKHLGIPWRNQLQMVAALVAYSVARGEEVRP